ncbi:MAG: hypothetical protein H6634_09235 [Anaerolineales bacterium]|nr:hypothetical protein [Anaerolineales bacterium]
MKNILFNLHLSVSKINKTHLQFIWVLIVLTMLVLGAGAPEDVGGVGIR